MIKSITDCKKTVLLKFLFKNVKDFLTKCGYLKDGIYCLCEKIKNCLIEENEEYLDYIQNEEETNIETILKNNKGSSFCYVV